MPKIIVTKVKTKTKVLHGPSIFANFTFHIMKKIEYCSTNSLYGGNTMKNFMNWFATGMINLIEDLIEKFIVAFIYSGIVYVLFYVIKFITLQIVAPMMGY